MTLDLRHAYKGLPLLGVIHNACSDDHILPVLGYTILKSLFPLIKLSRLSHHFCPKSGGFLPCYIADHTADRHAAFCLINSARPLDKPSPTLERSNKGAKCRRSAHLSQTTLRPRPVKPACLGTCRASTRISFQRCALISANSRLIRFSM